MRERLRLIRLLRRHGIEYPIITYQEAKRAGVELAVVAAVLEQETGGGRNVFGHDPTIFIGAGKVTKEKYRAYLKARGPKGRGGMQGVGPMQLTWYAFQDEADREGGCWKPRPNIRVGIRILARNLAEHDLRTALRNYNGSWSYADAVLIKVAKWRKRLVKPLVAKPFIPPRQGFDSLHPSMHAAYTASIRAGFADLGTFAAKAGSHGLRPAYAYDLGHRTRFHFLGWDWLKARRHARWLAKHADELGIRYILLGKKMWHCRDRRWGFFADTDGTHAFHIHVNGHDPGLTPCP